MTPKVLLFDLWNTLITSDERNQIGKSIVHRLNSYSFENRDFFYFWKENWFKKENDIKTFLDLINNNFNLNSQTLALIENYFNYKNLKLIPERIKLVEKLKSRGYELHLVSDCGNDFKDFIEKTGLSNIFELKFYSFLYETTKDEKLYSHVIKDLKPNCLMIGDDVKRDYQIPKKYGLSSQLIKPTDSLEDFLIEKWNIF